MVELPQALAPQMMDLKQAWALWLAVLLLYEQAVQRLEQVCLDLLRQVPQCPSNLADTGTS